MRALILFVLAAGLAPAQETFEVVRKKPLWLDQPGALRVTDAGLCFDAKGEEPRCWDFLDIQHFDRVSPAELVLLSYEDVAWKLGRDRSYRFELTSGEISDALFERLTAAVGRPATDRVVAPPDDALETLPVKRLKTFGGSEGELYVSPERIVYASDAPGESREWRLDREVAAVWSADRYRLEVQAWEGNPGSFRKPEVYRFALKEPLDPELYRRLKMRLYDIQR